MGALAGALPDGSRYTVAIQNPAVVFRDPRLIAARPALDRLGLPIVSAGGFAVAYRLDAAAGSWAVRCFTRLTDGIDRRYRTVSAFLRATPRPYLLSVDYLPDGLLVERSRWPITVMPWVEGLTLNEWVAAHLRDRPSLEQAARQIADVVDGLEAAGAAHGDLQHGNILVGRDGRLVLVDYDGMFVPGLEGEPMPEVGHPHYQHPLRGTMAFGPTLDRFSAALIWTALRATAVRPDLWDQFDTGENLLFTAKDLANPVSSPLFGALHAEATIRPLAAGLERLLNVSPESLPTLQDFMAGRLPEAEDIAVDLGAIAPFPVLDLRRPDALDGRLGQRVIAVGEIIEQVRGWTYRNDPYVFLRIGTQGRSSLKIVLWSEMLAKLASHGHAMWAAGTLVGITGMVSDYKGSRQIVLERPALLERLDATRARDLLGSAWREPPPARAVATDLRVGDVVEHDKFGQGVVLALNRDVADVRFSAEVKLIQFTTYPLRLIRRPAGPARKPVAPRPAPPRPKPAPPTGPAGQPGSGYVAIKQGWGELIESAVAASTTPRQAARRKPAQSPTRAQSAAPPAAAAGQAAAARQPVRGSGRKSSARWARARTTWDSMGETGRVVTALVTAALIGLVAYGVFQGTGSLAMVIGAAVAGVVLYAMGRAA